MENLLKVNFQLSKLKIKQFMIYRLLNSKLQTIRQNADLEVDMSGHRHKSPSLFIDRCPSHPPLFIILKTVLLSLIPRIWLK